jgi:hypothetical protein
MVLFPQMRRRLIDDGEPGACPHWRPGRAQPFVAQGYDSAGNRCRSRRCGRHWRTGRQRGALRRAISRALPGPAPTEEWDPAVQGVARPDRRALPPDLAPGRRIAMPLAIGQLSVLRRRRPGAHRTVVVLELDRRLLPLDSAACLRARSATLSRRSRFRYRSRLRALSRSA